MQRREEEPAATRHAFTGEEDRVPKAFTPAILLHAMEPQLLQMFEACAYGTGAPVTSYVCNAAASVYSLLPHLVKGMVLDVVKLTVGEQLSCGTDPSFACDVTVDFSTLVTAIIFGGGLVMMITTTAWPLLSPRMREARRRAGETRRLFRDFGGL